MSAFGGRSPSPRGTSVFSVYFSDPLPAYRRNPKSFFPFAHLPAPRPDAVKMLGNCRDLPPSVRRLAPHLLHILTLVWSVPFMPMRPPQVLRLVVLCLLPFALSCVK